MPISRAFLNMSPRFPSKGALPRCPPQWACSERCQIPRALFIQLSKSLVDKPPSRFPYGNRCLSPEPFQPILQGPQQGSPPSRFPSQTSYRARHPTFRAPFSHLSKSLVEESTPGCPAVERCPSPEPSFHNPRGPQQRSPLPPPGSPNGAPTERDAPKPEPSFR